MSCIKQLESFLDTVNGRGSITYFENILPLTLRQASVRNFEVTQNLLSLNGYRDTEFRILSEHVSVNTGLSFQNALYFHTDTRARCVLTNTTK